MISIDFLKERYKMGSSSEKELKSLYEKIDHDNQKTDPVNAYNFLTKDLAKEMVKNSTGPLAGIFIAIKDNIHIKGEKTTCSSRILKNYEAIYDSTVVSLLRKAGAVIVGKANMDEFAMGASNTTSFFGDVHNPHDRKRVAGGSSGGSAAAIAAGFTSLALGTDTGGSVRVPSAYCGVVGLKPTYGAISRYGVMSMSPILDQIGPMASNVQDCALLYSVLAHYDENDPNSITAPPLDFSSIARPTKKKKIGLIKEFASISLNGEISKKFEMLVSDLKKEGHEVVEISLPHAANAIETYFIISRVQGFSALSMMDGIRYGERVEGDNLEELYEKSRGQGFHQEVSKRILMGYYLLSKTDLYPRARKMQTILFQEFEKIFQTTDVVLFPTTLDVAPSLNSKGLFSVEGFSVDMIASLSNLTGTPAISVPMGKNSEGLPIGVQVMGPLCSEQQLFELAMSIQNLGY